MEVPNWRPAGMDRSISSRTMGVGLTLSTSTEKRYGSRLTLSISTEKRYGSRLTLSTSTEKRYGSRSSPPSAERIVPSAQGRRGWVNTADIGREKYGCRTFPPAGTHRSIDERTMGVGLTIDTSAGRLKDVDISGEKLRSRPYPPASPGSFHRQKTIVA
jgi:hypothetical protein